MHRKIVQRMGYGCMALCLAIGLPGCPCFFQGAIFIPDQALESAIRDALRQPFGCLTADDLLGVTEIQGANLGITDLRGIEYCESLLILDLRSNDIRSITPLAGLANLTWMDLSDNRITDIDPLAGLFFLEYLDISGYDNDMRVWDPLVANAQAGGIGSNTTLTLSPEWTIDPEGNFYPDFQEAYLALTEAGVTIIFAETVDSQDDQ